MESKHPVQLAVTDDLVRNRLTAFFRFFLAIPHLIWVSLWGVAVVFAVIVSWFATLFAGETPAGLHSFIARWLRYSTHVRAYLYLVADPFPDFMGDGGYPIDLHVTGPAPQRRVVTGFRIILAIPVLIVSAVLDYLAQALAVISWFVAIFTGRVPQGVRNLAAWCSKFTGQTYAYALLLTDRYPSFDGINAES